METTSHNHVVTATEEDRLRDLIEALSAYIEQYHGGWVELEGWDGDVIQVRMGGACDECALSAATLQGWIGGTVRQFFPHIRQVIAV